MKKSVSILLAAVMTFVVTACGRSNPYGFDSDIAESRAKSFFGTLDFEHLAYYSKEVRDGESIQLYVSGDSLYMKMTGSHSIEDMAMLSVDGVTYLINDKEKYCFFKPSDGEFEEKVAGMLADLQIDFDTAILEMTGTTNFVDESRYFEQIMLENQDVMRLFFDDEWRLIGQQISGLTFLITMDGDIPQGAFDIPDGYTMIDITPE